MSPMDRSLYPDEWAEIANEIKFDRAGGKCEQCGVAHGALIVRSDVDAARYLVVDEETMIHFTPDGQAVRLSEIPDEYLSEKYVRVWLNVHHVGIDKPDGSPGSPHDKMDNRPENLLCLCQRCHLLADMGTHVPKRKATMKQKRIARLGDGGQLLLPGIEAV
jgi:hypothetical protein